MKKIFMILTCLILLICLGGCKKSSDFSEKEHTRRIEKLIEKRYFKGDNLYKSYELYPVYNENDVLSYYIIEFEPNDYVYIKINENDLSSWYGVSMYTRFDGQKWQRYKINYNSGDTIEDEEKLWEIDEHGNYIYYNCSHYKAANVKSDKRYLLKIKQGGRDGYIPALKKHNKYLNLISMEEFIYEPILKTEVQPMASISFIAKNDFNL